MAKPTLDGQDASITFPKIGAAIVTTPGGRRLTIRQDRAREIMRRDGAFESPVFARPREVRL